MAPPKGRRLPDQLAGAGMTGERRTVPSKRTVRQNRQLQKSALADVSAAPAPRPAQSKGADSRAASGFTRPGA
eukprot:4975944-Alexandrium_andersonii.AAC.1